MTDADRLGRTGQVVIFEHSGTASTEQHLIITRNKQGNLFMRRRYPPSQQPHHRHIDQPDKEAEECAEQIDILELLLHDREQQAF